MAELFQTTVPNINQHLKAIYDEGELFPQATIKRYLIVQTEGNRQIRRAVDHYNLDVIIAVGYRVKSPRGTQFRIWATERLREYLVKGFTLDDERLKRAGGGNYFEELLARIRDIRSSERVFWRKVLDIYATSIDYDPSDEASHSFSRPCRTRCTGRLTATRPPRSSITEPMRRNRTWDSPHGRAINPRKTDISIAKNYLNQEEIESLNLIVSAYLDFAELQARNRRPMHMADWIAKLDDFLRLSERDILTHAGKISHEQAVEKAEVEFEEYRHAQAVLPQSVDEHFEQSLDELKQIEQQKKAPPEKEQGKRKPRKKKPKSGNDQL